MKRFTDKITAMAGTVCVVTLLGLVGCTWGEAQSTEDVREFSGEEVTIVEKQKAWGPNYERDDPTAIRAIVTHSLENSAVEAELRWGPNYDEETTFISPMSMPIANGELRWGPTYAEDDPALVGNAVR